MCSGLCLWLLHWANRVVDGGRIDACPTRCPLCNRAWCNPREGPAPCAVRRAVEEANMRDYMRWIVATFPNELVRGSDTTFPAAIACFEDRFPRDSSEYGELLDYFMLQAGQRYMRLGVVEFVGAVAATVHVVDQIAGHMDGEMHEYIQWIARNRGHLHLEPRGPTVADVIHRFLEHVHRDSPIYRAVFRRFSSNPAANHTDAAMDDFVRELRWVLPPLP